MKNLSKNVVLWIIIGLLLIVLFNLFQGSNPSKNSSQISFSDFMAATESGTVSEVNISGNNVTGFLNDGRAFSTYAPNYPNLVDKLNESGVKISAEPANKSMHPLLSVLLSWFPMLLLIGVWIFFMRQMQGGGGKAMGFGKSKAKLLNEAVGKVTFEDVAGIDEAKQELEEVVEFLKDPQKFSRLGGKIPRGALLVGPPGTGKTLLARAIAGEANVPFFSISGSDFVEMFVGVGASRVRDMFDQGKKNAPCIIFIDEIDAVGRHRGAGLGGGNDEREQTLNQLLVEMDGFEGNEGVIVIAATNRPDVLDKALLRPGRFDRQVYVSLPDIRGREHILKVHSRKVPLHESVSLSVLARGTPGFSGADLANLVNEAALFSARANRRFVTMEEFEKARDKIMMGAERKSMVMSEKEKINTAYHEAGHAIIGRLVPQHDPVHKVTIIPRGRALGVTQYLPEEDRYSMNRIQLFSQLCSLFGGRIAEEIVGGFDNVTTGASNDIERATQMARNMVTKWGLNQKMGPVLYGEDESQVPGGGNTHYSEDTSREIDQEVRIILDEAYKKASKLLDENKDILDSMKDALIEYETIDADQVDDLMNRKAVRKPKDWDKTDKDGGSSKQDKKNVTENGPEIGSAVEEV